MDGLKLGIASLVIGITGATATLIGGLTYGEIKDTVPIQQRIEENEEDINRVASQGSGFYLARLYSESADLHHEAGLLFAHNRDVYHTRFEISLLAGGLSVAFLLTGIYLNEKHENQLL